MSDAEVRALRRAVVLLLVLSAARWLHAIGPVDAPLAPEGAVPGEAPGHATRTRAAVRAEELRTRPVAEGETMDPNQASVDELDRLPGVGPSRARAIAEIRASGTIFRKPEDLLAVPGIGPAAIERIRPHLSFADAGRAGAPPSRRAVGSGARSAGHAPPVDINRADPNELVRLPRIGPVTAQRIVAARRERPFSSLEDLGRVPGIGPATLDGLRGLVTVGPGRR